MTPKPSKGRQVAAYVQAFNENAHGGLSYLNRGAEYCEYPAFWVNKKRNEGWTLHHLNEPADTPYEGPVVFIGSNNHGLPVVVTFVWRVKNGHAGGTQEG